MGCLERVFGRRCDERKARSQADAAPQRSKACARECCRAEGKQNWLRLRRWELRGLIGRLSW